MPVLTITTESYSAHIALVLQRRFGDLRHAAKRIGRLADSSPRAARTWLAGDTGPNVAALLTLMAREPAIEAAVAELVQRQRELDEQAGRRPA